MSGRKKDSPRPRKADAQEPEAAEDGLEAFLDRASEAMGGVGGKAEDLLHPPGAPQHRKLRIVVSDDRLEARLEAVFPDTTLAEVAGALKQAGIIWGIQKDATQEALKRAERSGRLQRDILVAEGRPAVYREQKEVHYPFLEELQDPESGESLHIASAAFREIAEVMGQSDIEGIRGYGRTVVAVAPGEVLMVAQGEDEVEPGRDVFGREIRKVREKGPGMLKAGDGVDLRRDGSMAAANFGYVSVVGSFLSVVSPIWISPDRMEAYFVNPPQLGERKVPDPETILKEMEEMGIRFGIDREATEGMCRDLRQGALRESCVRIARGQRPNLSKRGTWFAFEPPPPARFEAVRNALRMLDLKDVVAVESKVAAVHAGQVIAERSEEGRASASGRDLFGEPVAPPEEAQDRKLYKPGVNVRREVVEGTVRYLSEIYGYAGVLGDRIMVVSPLWVSPDRMKAWFVALPQGENPVFPTIGEVEALLERAAVRYGIDSGAVVKPCRMLPGSEDSAESAVLLARGTRPRPGGDGRVELLFKQMPDPGKFLEDGRIDFRERDAVPQAHVGQLLARRTLPTPGAPGTDVRGRALNPPRPQRDLLYAGPNVTVEEKEGKQLFYATQSGYARVLKDTLSVMNRLRHRGDVDYRTGNLKVEGDAEIEGTVRNRFKVEATGDVYIGGSVERRAQITAGGSVVVQRGIIGAEVKAKGSLCARFVQDSEVKVGGDLLVRNYIQDSQVQAQGKAIVQGNEGGERQLCLLGGALVATSDVEATSIGSAYGRQTRVVVGIDMETEARLERYRKGLTFCDLNNRRAIRALGTVVGQARGKAELVAALRRVPPGRQDFLVRQLKELETMQKLKVSLEHYVGELEKERTEIAGRARVRVPGTAFARVTVQIGEIYKTLEKDVRTAIFHLNRERTQIVQELLSKATP